MKNTQLHPLVANLPTGSLPLMRRARELPTTVLTRRPAWWLHMQLMLLSTGRLHLTCSIPRFIGLPPRLPYPHRQVYIIFLRDCRHQGLTEEQILLLLLLAQEGTLRT